MAKDHSKQERIYLAIWRKAFQTIDHGEPIAIKASSKPIATAQRLGLYRALRPYREGKLFDAELQQAGERIVACLVESKGRWAVELRPRETLSELEAQLAALGLDDAKLQTPEELLAQADLTRLLDEAKPRSTKFYSRED